MMLLKFPHVNTCPALRGGKDIICPFRSGVTTRCFVFNKGDKNNYLYKDKLRV